jgi:hypothetical protein
VSDEGIDYKPPKTLRAFIRHYVHGALFYDWVIGPLGAGKTTALFFKLVHMAKLQEPSPDGIRHTRAVIVRNCFDDQTEILTEQRGWQLFRDLRDDDRVAMLQDGKTVFVVPTLHYHAPYRGKMLGCKQQNLDFLVTPDHNLWTATINGRTKERAPYKLEPCAAAFGKTNREFSMTAGWDGTTKFTLELFEFLGFWFAEGYAGVYAYPDREPRLHHRLVLSQKVAIEYARDVMRRAGFEWGEHDKGHGNFNLTIRLDDRTTRLCEELAACGKATTKAIPLWIKHAPPEHLRAFLHGFVMGDGHLKNAACDTTRVYTASKQLADDLQEIAFLAGYATTQYCRDRRNDPQPLPQGGFFGGVLYSVTLLTDLRASPCPRAESWYEQEYDGVVYCVEVPTHVVYVRRNGKPFWCSQTMPQLRDTTLVSWGYWFQDGVCGHWSATNSIFMLRFDDVECEVLFRPLDTADDIRRVLSLEVTFAIIDEFVQIPKSIIDALSGRLGRWKKYGEPTNWGMWGSSNPDTEDNWWHDYLHDEKTVELVNVYEDEDCARVRHVILRPDCNISYFVQPSGLGPNAENLAHLPPFIAGDNSYYTNQAIGKGRAWIKQFLDAEWGFSASGRPVVGSFRPDIHLSKKPLLYNSAYPLIAGLDPGLAGTAMVFGQEDLYGRLLVLGEITARGMGATRFITDKVKPYLRHRFPGAEVIVAPDPASASRVQTDEAAVVDIFKKYFQVKIETNNHLAKRLDAIESFTSRLTDMGPALLIDKAECPMLCRALAGGWRYDKIANKNDQLKPTPEKNEYSHVGDGFGYLCRYFHRQWERGSARGETVTDRRERRPIQGKVGGYHFQ